MLITMYSLKQNRKQKNIGVGVQWVYKYKFRSSKVEDAITFGQWVKQRRNALGLTQAELGNLAFCSAVMIKKIEGNQRRPSIQIARLLARHLKIVPKNHPAFM